MTLGTNSSLGALRTEAVTGWELCQPENFPESSKLAHSKSKSPTSHPIPNHHSAAPPRALAPAKCLPLSHPLPSFMGSSGFSKLLLIPNLTSA